MKKQLIMLNFKKARGELGLNDCDELTHIYVKKEDYDVDGFNYSIYLQSKGQKKPSLYLECDLRESTVSELILKDYK